MIKTSNPFENIRNSVLVSMIYLRFWYFDFIFWFLPLFSRFQTTTYHHSHTYIQTLILSWITLLIYQWCLIQNCLWCDFKTDCGAISKLTEVRLQIKCLESIVKRNLWFWSTTLTQTYTHTYTLLYWLYMDLIIFA